ncbi:MAG: flavodoxin [Desulfovibrio sp.]|nr:flavodoxin [Desulfovibrio sp.]
MDTDHGTQNMSAESKGMGPANKILVAYFSRADENYNVGYIEKGNTEIIAEMIAKQVNGTLFHIKTVMPYPTGYKECTEVAKKEKADGARPKIVGKVEDFADYNIVFLGYPNWWSDMPMAVYTFLESYDFSGKTIIPFITHEGSGLSNTVKSIAEYCPNAKVLDGLAIKGSIAQKLRDEAQKTVTNWLSKIPVLH